MRFGHARRASGWWTVAAYTVGGIVGGAVGVLLVIGLTDIQSSISLGLDVSMLSWVMVVLAMAGGVLAGWFVAALALSWAPGRVHCPRCGTPNRRDAIACRACGF